MLKRPEVLLHWAFIKVVKIVTFYSNLMEMLAWERKTRKSRNWLSWPVVFGGNIVQWLQDSEFWETEYDFEYSVLYKHS